MVPLLTKYKPISVCNTDVCCLTDYFRVSNAGELIVNRTLVRSMALYTVVVTVQDMGMPPLSTAVTVQVNVNSKYSLNCFLSRECHT